MPTHQSHDESGPIGRLALADGTVFRGRAFGATGRGIRATGEVVFNTALTGYQESLTDPSYAGQILVQTTPLVGNTGVNDLDVESDKVHVRGFVIHELARRHSNFRAVDALHGYLDRQGVLALCGVDTRALTRRLRAHGVLGGALTDDPALADAGLVDAARAVASMEGQDLAAAVGCSADASWSEPLGDWAPAGLDTPGDQPRDQPGDRAPRPTVLALDCGAKRNILRHLVERGCRVRLIPHDTPAAEIRRVFEAGEAQGLFISNGPGDPAAVEQTVATLRTLLTAPGPTIPTFGICLGHQLIALAIGATTYKLKFGHRGANQPVLSRISGHVEITSQNHGFAVDTASLEAAGGEPTHVHLNDQTLAGFRLRDRPVFAVQYHPEASPGPHDASELFDRFVRMMERREPVVLASATRR